MVGKFVRRKHLFSLFLNINLVLDLFYHFVEFFYYKYKVLFIDTSLKEKLILPSLR